MGWTHAELLALDADAYEVLVEELQKAYARERDR
jgi:hypothetical protein